MARHTSLGSDTDLVEFECDPRTGLTVGVYDSPRRHLDDLDQLPRETVTVRGSNGKLPRSGAVERHAPGAGIDTGEISGVMGADVEREGATVRFG